MQIMDNIEIIKQNSSLDVTKDDIKHVVDYYPYGKILREEVLGDDERFLTTQYERDQSTGLDYRGARYYDADVARFLSLDPLASQFPSWSDYNYVMGNPVMFIDPDGRAAETTIVTKGEEDGTYTVTGWIDDGKTDVVLREDCTVIGQSLTTHSFVNEHNSAVVGAKIDTRSSEGQRFINEEIIGDHPNFITYGVKAYKVGTSLDFKSRDLGNSASLLVHATRGSMTEDGKMASARDFGNMAAGIVAGRSGFTWTQANRAFEWLQGGNEPINSSLAQQKGFEIGVGLIPNDNLNISNKWKEGLIERE